MSAEFVYEEPKHYLFLSVEDDEGNAVQDTAQFVFKDENTIYNALPIEFTSDVDFKPTRLVAMDEHNAIEVPLPEVPTIMSGETITFASGSLELLLEDIPEALSPDLGDTPPKETRDFALWAVWVLVLAAFALSIYKGWA